LRFDVLAEDCLLLDFNIRKRSQRSASPVYMWPYRSQAKRPDNRACEELCPAPVGISPPPAGLAVCATLGHGCRFMGVTKSGLDVGWAIVIKEGERMPGLCSGTLGLSEAI
jgi:hypothetical protein